jgi:hypothetical protein
MLGRAGEVTVGAGNTGVRGLEPGGERWESRPQPKSPPDE